MQISENFTLKELLKSETALRRGIKNEITNQEHLRSLIVITHLIAQSIRDKFGPVRINSAYRSPELNEAVNGSEKSQHCKGEALDLEVMGTSNLEVAQWIVNELDFDQIILEGWNEEGLAVDSPEYDINAGWIHVSYNPVGPQRGNVLRTSDFRNYLPGLLPT